ncbi:hypothetical protein Q8A67_018421 [Cirrhinus molitorella]|uniref:Uncharacterized protein n=1 Tax=Cirrhinus molitorella TaxID=172907 RepID=A0AA88PED5_9TELE|nr:hypothetical protein Q8A67_018421 [Cirrhinus molitorella]
MLRVLIAFFSADRSSKLPPDFPFIGTEASDFSQEREKEWSLGQSKEGGRTVSWEPPPSTEAQSMDQPPPKHCAQAQPSPRSGEPKP